MSKDQINLPKTAFSMKANLPLKEPKIVEHWNKIDLYNLLRENNKGKEMFVLHDGPPYANGNIHMGTAFNKILLEVNIFNFKKNLYNKKLTVEFLKFIRGEKKFNGIDELKKQIKKDVKTAKELK